MSHKYGCPKRDETVIYVIYVGGLDLLTSCEAHNHYVHIISFATREVLSGALYSFKLVRTFHRDKIVICMRGHWIYWPYFL